jgi:hypothetical protein
MDLAPTTPTSTATAAEFKLKSEALNKELTPA